jgi:hypothetical protein
MIASTESFGVANELAPGTRQNWEMEKDLRIAQIFDRFIKSFENKERAQLKALLLMVKSTFEAILEEPYNDYPRILDERTHDRLLRNPFLRAVFEDCGFQAGNKGRSLVFEYGNSFNKLLIYKDLLETHLARLKDNLDVNAADFVDFPFTRSCIGMFSKDLSQKCFQDERIALKITFDEVLLLQKTIEVTRLEEYVCCFGTSREEFQAACIQIIPSRHRLSHFYVLLRNLWVEACALRKSVP